MFAIGFGVWYIPSMELRLIPLLVLIFAGLSGCLTRGDTYVDLSEAGSVAATGEFAPGDFRYFKWTASRTGYFQPLITPSSRSSLTAWKGFLPKPEHLLEHSYDIFAQKGDRFLLRLESKSWFSESYSMKMYFGSHKENDHYLLAIDQGSVLGTLHEESQYSNDRVQEEIGPHNSLWVKWRAPHDGKFLFAASSSSNKLGIYAPGSDQLLGASDLSSEVLLELKDQQEVLIGFSGRGVSVVDKSFASATVPERLDSLDEEFSKAVDLTGRDDDPFLESLGYTGPSNWFYFTPSEDMVVGFNGRIDSGQEYRTFVFGRTLGSGTKTLITTPELGSALIKLELGYEYSFAIVSLRDPAAVSQEEIVGYFFLSPFSDALSLHDDISGAVQIPASHVATQLNGSEGRTGTLQMEDAELLPSEASLSESIWARWTADFTGTAAIGGGATHIFEGATAARQLIASQEIEGLLRSWNCTMGKEYLIRIGRRFVLEDTTVTLVRLDDLIQDFPVSISGTDGVSRIEAQDLGQSLLEPFPPLYNSTGFLKGTELEWIAPEAGRFQFSASDFWGRAFFYLLDIVGEEADGSFKLSRAGLPSQVELIQAVAGQRFKIRIASDRRGSLVAPDHIYVRWKKIASAPQNDSVASAQNLVTGELTSGTLDGATAELSDQRLSDLPRHLEAPTSDDRVVTRAVHYRWIPAESGGYRISSGAESSVRVSLYPEGDFEKAFPSFSGSVNAWIPATVPYRVTVFVDGGIPGDHLLDFKLQFEKVDLPKGSFFEDPIEVNGNAPIVAEVKGPEVQLGEITSDPDGRIWYRWTVPSSDHYSSYPRFAYRGSELRDADPLRIRFSATGSDVIMLRSSLEESDLEDLVRNNQLGAALSATPLPVLPSPITLTESFPMTINLPDRTFGQYLVLPDYKFTLTSERTLLFESADSFTFRNLFKIVGDDKILLVDYLNVDGTEGVHLPAGDYVFSWDPFFSGSQGVTLTISEIETVPGDHWEDPLDFGSEFGSFESIAGLTSRQFDEPTGTRYSGGSVWGTWKAPFDGLFYISDFYIREPADLPSTGYQSREFIRLKKGEEMLLVSRKASDQSQPWRVGGVFDATPQVNATSDTALPLQLELGVPTPIKIHGTGPSPESLSYHEVNRMFFASWYSWQVPTDGIYRVEGAQKAFVKDDNGTLIPVPNEISSNSQYHYFASEGSTLYFLCFVPSMSISGWSPTLTVHLESTDVEFAQNDNFEDAIELTAADFGGNLLYNSTLNATKEVGEPGELAKSLWWKFSPEVSRRINFSRSIKVYEGVNLLDLVLQEQRPHELTIPANYLVEAGKTYFFQYEYERFVTWGGIVEIRFTAFSPNDLVADAEALVPGETKTFDMSRSTSSLEGRPRDLWYHVTSEEDLVLKLETPWQLLIEVYHGEALPENLLISSTSDLVFRFQAGITYTVRVEEKTRSVQSSYELVTSVISPVSHDERSSPVNFGRSSDLVHNIVLGPSTPNPEEDGNSIELQRSTSWATFQAAAQGLYRFSNRGLEYQFEIYYEDFFGNPARTGLCRSELLLNLEQDQVVEIAFTSGTLELASFAVQQVYANGDQVENALPIGDCSRTQLISEMHRASIRDSELEDNELEDASWASVWWIWEHKEKMGRVRIKHDGPGPLEQSLTVISVSGSSAFGLAGAVSSGIHGNEISASFRKSNVTYIRYSCPRKYTEPAFVTFESDSETFHAPLSRGLINEDLQPYDELRERTNHSSVASEMASVVARVSHLSDTTDLGRYVAHFQELPHVGSPLKMSADLFPSEGKNSLLQLSPAQFVQLIDDNYREHFEIIVSQSLRGVSLSYSDFFASSEFGVPIAIDAVDALSLYYLAGASLALADFCSSIESDLTLGELLESPWTRGEMLSWYLQNEASFRWRQDEDRRFLIDFLSWSVLPQAQAVLAAFQEGLLAEDRTSHFYQGPVEQLTSLVETLSLFGTDEDNSGKGVLSMDESPSDFLPVASIESGKIWAYSLLDPTFGGAVPDGTHRDWNARLRAVDSLANPATFSEWVLKIKETSPGFDGGRDEDHDSDGRTNWEEYAWGSDPFKFDAHFQGVSLESPSFLTLKRRIEPLDVVYELQELDGSSWVPLDAVIEETVFPIPNSDIEGVRFHLSEPQSKALFRAVARPLSR